MASFDIFSPFLRSWEGGFVNNPNDPGGATNCGITMATWTAYCKRHGMTANVSTLKAMSPAVWKDIMKSGYWDKVSAGGIKCQGVANMVADWAVNAGVVTAAKALQRACGAKPDGVVGTKTLLAVNEANPAIVFRALRAARLEYYENLAKRKPALKQFLAGWERRVKSIRLQSLVLNDKANTELTW